MYTAHGMPNLTRSELPRSAIWQVEYAEGKHNDGLENDVDLADRDITAAKKVSILYYS